MRHNKTDEADQTSEGDGRGGGEGGEGNGDAALATHINAEMRRPFIAEQEGGKCTAASHKEQRSEGDRYGGGGETWHVTPSRPPSRKPKIARRFAPLASITSESAAASSEATA